MDNFEDYSGKWGKIVLTAVSVLLYNARCIVSYYESVDRQLCGLHACMQGHIDIGQPSRYEQVGRQAVLRIPAAIVGAPKARNNRLS